MPATDLRRQFQTALLAALAWSVASTVPSKSLYPLAVRLSRALALAARGLKWVGLGVSSTWLPPDDLEGLALRNLLTALTYFGARFTPEVRLDGIESLMEYYAVHGRAILCSAHYPLNRVLLRVLEDHRLRSTLITGPIPIDARFPGSWAWGARHSVRHLPSSTNVLLRARGELRSGRVLVLDVDSAEATAEGTRFGSGPCVRYVSHAVFHLARLTQTPVLYFAARRSDDRAILLSLRKAPVVVPQSGDDVVRCARACAEFLGQQLRQAAAVAPR
jgi:lauroyl/myristoyl acyltransferase